MEIQQITCIDKALKEFLEAGLRKLPGVSIAQGATFRVDTEGKVGQACFIGIAAVGAGLDVDVEGLAGTSRCLNKVAHELASTCNVPRKVCYDALKAGVNYNDVRQPNLEGSRDAVRHALEVSFDC